MVAIPLVSHNTHVTTYRPNIQTLAPIGYPGNNCSYNAATCTETYDWTGYYTGHDEPSVLFYDNRTGSGNSNIYLLKLPNEPPTLPTQDGTGGTFNFQLHPAFWFGMALCDTQSAPEYTNSCTPNSDTNIFDNSNPASSSYVGKHPGTAFMEMQFYPPGWATWATGGHSCDGVQWCAALNIDSFIENMNNGIPNNGVCRSVVGDEPVNFAFITKTGTPHAPPDPVSTATNPVTTTQDPVRDLWMNPGDLLRVDQHDTPSGLQIIITDLTSHTTGSMTTSAANGFGQIKYDPSGAGCTVIPYDFHPMYSTSSEHTRVVWAAHSYNIAFADEIGHFEYCNLTAGAGVTSCTLDGVHDTDASATNTEDDVACHNAADSSRVLVSGCLGTDTDFDGPEYMNNWPGTNTNVVVDQQFHAQPIIFTSPLFRLTSGDEQTLTSFQRTAFETDLPRIEFDTIPPCQRHVSNPSDPNPGQGCVNPPVGAQFYPIFTTGNNLPGTCSWQEGGRYIPGTTNTFGGSSTTEYGPLFTLAYPAAGFQPTIRYNDFRNVLSSNPCPTPTPGDDFEMDQEQFGEHDNGGQSSGPEFDMSMTNTGGHSIRSVTVTLNGFNLPLTWSTSFPVQPYQATSTASPISIAGFLPLIGSVYPVTVTATFSDGTTVTHMNSVTYSIL